METDRLHLPSNPDLWVDMRRRILWGDELAVESAVVATRQLAPLQGVAALKRQRIYQLIEGWSLRLTPSGEVGLAGEPLPMEPGSLDRLEPRDGDFLYQYARHRFENREDVANPFVPGLPASSPEAGRARSSRRKSS